MREFIKPWQRKAGVVTHFNGDLGVASSRQAVTRIHLTTDFHRRELLTFPTTTEITIETSQPRR
jgi:hypothetical protein